MQRLEKGRVIDLHAARGSIFDPARDLEGVHRRPRQRFEHERVQRTPENWHWLSSSYLGVDTRKRKGKRHKVLASESAKSQTARSPERRGVPNGAEFHTALSSIRR